ncbi:MAG: FecR domain-containing protein [Lachnospiraceae bacterium]|nr:FecR domain-containing protein [Lachnospiraceae bacterium]
MKNSGKKQTLAKQVSSVLMSTLLAFSFCASPSCLVQAASEDGTASVVRFAKAEGKVSIKDAGGSLPQKENMRLFSGNSVSTEEQSYAWLNLDDSKAVKLDAVSEAEVRKSGKDLEVLSKSGNLFFNVTKPLKSDESMKIRTSTMVMGIRGTCGWVKFLDATHTCVYLLEGHVECKVFNPATGEEESIILNPGESATFFVAEKNDSSEGEKTCGVEKSTFSEKDVEGFVLMDLTGDPSTVNEIFKQSHIDLRDITPEQAQAKQTSDQSVLAAKTQEVENQKKLQETTAEVLQEWDETPSAHDSQETADSSESSEDNESFQTASLNTNPNGVNATPSSETATSVSPETATDATQETASATDTSTSNGGSESTSDSTASTTNTKKSSSSDDDDDSSGGSSSGGSSNSSSPSLVNPSYPSGGSSNSGGSGSTNPGGNDSSSDDKDKDKDSDSNDNKDSGTNDKDKDSNTDSDKDKDSNTEDNDKDSDSDEDNEEEDDEEEEDIDEDDGIKEGEEEDDEEDDDTPTSTESHSISLSVPEEYASAWVYVDGEEGLSGATAGSVVLVPVVYEKEKYSIVFSVKDKNGNTIYYEKGDSDYSDDYAFVMPDSDVVVSASFTPLSGNTGEGNDASDGTSTTTDQPASDNASTPTDQPASDSASMTPDQPATEQQTATDTEADTTSDSASNSAPELYELAPAIPQDDSDWETGSSSGTMNYDAEANLSNLTSASQVSDMTNFESGGEQQATGSLGSEPVDSASSSEPQASDSLNSDSAGKPSDSQAAGSPKSNSAGEPQTSDSLGIKSAGTDEPAPSDSSDLEAAGESQTSDPLSTEPTGTDELAPSGSPDLEAAGESQISVPIDSVSTDTDDSENTDSQDSDSMDDSQNLDSASDSDSEDTTDSGSDSSEDAQDDGDSDHSTPENNDVWSGGGSEATVSDDDDTANEIPNDGIL